MRVEASFTRWGETASSTLSQSARYIFEAGLHYVQYAYACVWKGAHTCKKHGSMNDTALHHSNNILALCDHQRSPQWEVELTGMAGNTRAGLLEVDMAVLE